MPFRNIYSVLSWRANCFHSEQFPFQKEGKTSSTVASFDNVSIHQFSQRMTKPTMTCMTSKDQPVHTPIRHITKTRLFKYIETFTAKKGKFADRKIWYFFFISAQNIDCGYSLEPPRRGGSNEYPQSMFLSRNKKNNVYPCKPQFCYIKVGFKGVKII